MLSNSSILKHRGYFVGETFAVKLLLFECSFVSLERSLQCSAIRFEVRSNDLRIHDDLIISDLIGQLIKIASHNLQRLVIVH